jgi:hypothetical protein
LLLHWVTGEEEPWYLVSDQPGKTNLLKTYQHRMWIEMDGLQMTNSASFAMAS